MSAADYYLCPLCRGKALYDTTEGERPAVMVLHEQCYSRVVAELTHVTRERDNSLVWIPFSQRAHVQKLWAERREDLAAVASGCVDGGNKTTPEATPAPKCNGNCIADVSGTVVIEDLCCSLHGVGAVGRG